jgi:hypothetical protein
MEVLRGGGGGWESEIGTHDEFAGMCKK